MGRVGTAAALAALAAAAWMTAHRRSPAVRRWRPPAGPIQRHGPLAYRVAGCRDADTGVLLVHGLVATGDVFGGTPSLLGRRHRVLVPDLLGFGRSLDEHRTDFSSEAHLDALWGLVDDELGGRTLRIGAHSMGSALALRLAAARPDRIERVVCIGPPAWPDPASARAALGVFGPMGRSLVLDDRLARAVCAFNCRHRTLAGLLAAIGTPRWPIPVARQASLHTWPAYIDAVREQIVDFPWSDLVDAVADLGVPVRFVKGTTDSIGDDDFLGSLATRPGIDLLWVGGDHTLPAARPDLLVDALQ